MKKLNIQSHPQQRIQQIYEFWKYLGYIELIKEYDIEKILGARALLGARR